MSTRIPISWILLLALLAIVAFFGYHIVQASSTSEAYPPYSQTDEAKSAGRPRMAVDTAMADTSGGPDVPANDDAPEGPGPVVDRTPPHEMPFVPGQTEEDLRTPEPLQRTPPTTEYDIPSHRDPLNPTVNAEAEFGSNFRHPEQMIEARPQATMTHVVPSGLGSEHSSPGGNDAAGYAPEMAQNGGQWMNGIVAFDGSEEGTAYSLI
jgi:hypothetical protein